MIRLLPGQPARQSDSFQHCRDGCTAHRRLSTDGHSCTHAHVCTHMHLYTCTHICRHVRRCAHTRSCRVKCMYFSTPWLKTSSPWFASFSLGTRQDKQVCNIYFLSASGVKLDSYCWFQASCFMAFLGSHRVGIHTPPPGSSGNPALPACSAALFS